MKWEMKTLNELGFVGRGKSRHRPRNAEHLYGGIYPLIQTGDIQNANFYITKYSQTYSEEGLAQSKLWKEGTLVISIVGANTAETAILGFDACFPDSVIGFIPYEGISDAKFVKYTLECLKNHLKGISEGTARENLSLEKLLSVKTSIPSFPIQRKIASILSAYDDLIDNNLKRIKLLEEKAFLRYKGIVREEEMEEFFIEEVCETLGGGTPSTGDRRFWDEGEILWFSPTDLTKHNSIVLIDSDKKITELGLQKSSAKLVPPKTILMTSRASIGYFGLINKPASTNQGFINITPFNENHSAYMLFDLKNRKEEIIGNANGSTFLEISKGKFRQMKIKLPKNENVSVNFEREFKITFNFIENLLKQNAKLREARDILLPKLMNGQIEV